MPATSRRGALAWALYDWGNSAFATTVMAGFFPVFFKTWWAADLPATGSTLRLGVANSAAAVAVALLAPLLGAVADRGGTRRRWLGGLAAGGVVATLLLPAVARGDWATALVVYVLATLGWSGANVFYDSLLVGVAAPERTDRVSALGYALGYLGGGLLFAINVLMVRRPDLFGLADAAAAVRVSFVTVGAWWALFAVPLFLRVGEPPASGAGRRGALKAGWRQLVQTFRQARRHRTVFVFLLAYWLYIDGVDTIIRMAVDYGLSLGLPSDSLIVALLITQFVGFPAALVYGRLGERVGSKAGILIGIGVYVAVTIWAAFLDSVWEFYALAIAVGLVQGGIQALSRALYARLIPPDKTAEFFGLYNMLGKFAAVIGPLLMGGVGVITGSARLAILAVIVLFLAGGALLLKVDERRPAAAG